MNTVDKARIFAIKAHTGQQYGAFEYHKHLEDVVCVLKELLITSKEPGEAMLTAAWLHDTIEDTSTTFQELFTEFGRNVARIVLACTDEPGKNRKERHERTYPKLMAAGREAIAVKLADRIANVRHSLQYNHGRFSMYQKEYEAFKTALHLPGELKEMWATLDVLMQRAIEPEKK